MKQIKKIAAVLVVLAVILSVYGCDTADHHKKSHNDEAAQEDREQGETAESGDYMTPADDTEADASGRIVIGDSRCCQLGFYQQKHDRHDFAVVGVWGGHYMNAAEPQIITDDSFEQIKACFERQIESTGSSTIYFFATVNDCGPSDSENQIQSAVKAAERLAGLTYQKDNGICQPEIVVIGFAGVENEDPDDESSSEFNRRCDTFNDMLLGAAAADPLLSKNADRFTTVPAICKGSVSFAADGLHYNETTVRQITDYLASENKGR